MSSFVRRQTRRKVSAVAAACTLLVLSGCWVWHRSRFPANIDPPSGETHDEDGEDDEGGWWDPFTILLFVVSAVALVIVGIVARFVLPLLVIMLFSVGFGPDPGDVALVVLAMLGVSFVLEFAIVIPLCRLWNLDIDGETEPGSTPCPTASEQP